MNYPFWEVPIIGSGWVIGGIAIFHILISHFAIGGGFYLVLAEHKARRADSEEWLGFVKSHSLFFLILTAVFGTVSGVGIWFAIGLANPGATSALIHNFVFFWAIEWVFFLTEVAAAAVYYYTWDRLTPRAHLAVGWIYAISAWMSLFIINGILTFMLTPSEAWLGAAGTGRETFALGAAFFNATYWPSLVLRTLVCLALAGVWAFATASLIDGETRGRLKAAVVRWSCLWLVPAFALIPLGFWWYVALVPDTQEQLLRLGISTIGQGTFTQVTRAALVVVMTSATILAIVYFLIWREPRDVTLGHALSIIFLALAATGATEHARELIRKPYVIRDYMYSNSVRKADVDELNKMGFLAESPWAGAADRDAWAMLDADAAVQGAIDFLPLIVMGASEDQREAYERRGALMFAGQCMSCHTREGYRSMKRLLAERDRDAIHNILMMLHQPPDNSPYVAFMPPLLGRPEEIEALADYLAQLAHPPEAPDNSK